MDEMDEMDQLWRLHDSGSRYDWKNLENRYHPVSSNMACWKPWTIEIASFPIESSIQFGDFPAMELMTPEGKSY